MWERTTVEKYTDLFLVERQKQENKKKSLFKTEHYIEEFKYVWIVVWVMMIVHEIKDKEREEKERTCYAHF